MALTKAEDLRINSELYEALMSQEDAKVVDICRRIPKGPLHTLTIHEDSVLHMAAYHKKNDLVLELLEMVSICDNHKLTWQNGGGNTILHETCTNNRTVEAAAEMLRRAPMLLSMTNKEGETALFYAARHGKTNIFKFLHAEVSRNTQGLDLKTFLRRDDKFTILHIAVLSRNYWIAHELAITHKDLIQEKDADEMTALQLLSTTKPEFRPESIFKRMIFKLIDSDVENKSGLLPHFKKLRKEKHKCEWAVNLAKLLIKSDSSWEMTESWTAKRGTKSHEYGRSTSITEQEKTIAAAHEADVHKPDTPLLLATIHGSTEIVKEILRVYPQAVEHVDKDGHNILHLAILHRRQRIIDDVEDMEHPVKRLRGKLDKNFNTLLHMVGQKVDQLKEDIKDPAKELQEDARLFKRVEGLCTTLDKMTRNSDLKTAQEVFSENNDKLRSEAKEVMGKHAKNCSVVAVLIATVAFAAAYTLPGGADKQSGYPILKDKPMFLIFTIADAISLSSAMTSVIIFLNIMTSPFRFEDFQSSLFGKLYLGLMLLIVSVTMMMVAFAATLVLTISSGATWTNVILYSVSFFPVFVFVSSYIPQYKTLTGSLYWALKHTAEIIVLRFHKFWHLEPHSQFPTTRSIYLTTRSSV